jgi:hypothetical protein
MSYNLNALSNVVLLMTPVDMTKDGAGQLYLKALVSSVPLTSIISTRLPQGGYLEYSSGSGRISRAVASISSRLGIWQTMSILLYERKQLHCDTGRAQEMLKSHHAESCWITLSSPGCILLAHALMRSGVKVRVSVLDAPEHLLRTQNIFVAAAKHIMNRFGEVMRGATSVSVISTNMQERYRAQFGISAIVVRPICNMLPRSRKNIVHRRTLRLVFAGSLYAKEEWNALLRALDSMQWRIDERPIVVYFLGTFPLRGALSHRRVKQLGHRPAVEAAAICSKCDIAYLPYWLSGENAAIAATSFPSKLSFYLSCGLPLLNHGPATSETTRIMRDYEIGISCHSLAAEDIAHSLEALTRPAFMLATRKPMRNLVQMELSPAAVGEKFSIFLN